MPGIILRLNLRHRHQRAGVAGRDRDVGLALLHRVDGEPHRRLPAAVAQRLARLVVHPDRDVGVDEAARPPAAADGRRAAGRSWRGRRTAETRCRDAAPAPVPRPARPPTGPWSPPMASSAMRTLSGMDRPERRRWDAGKFRREGDRVNDDNSLPAGGHTSGRHRAFRAVSRNSADFSVFGLLQGGERRKRMARRIAGRPAPRTRRRLARIGIDPQHAGIRWRWHRDRSRRRPAAPAASSRSSSLKSRGIGGQRGSGRNTRSTGSSTASRAAPASPRRSAPTVAVTRPTRAGRRGHSAPGRSCLEARQRASPRSWRSALARAVVGDEIDLPAGLGHVRDRDRHAPGTTGWIDSAHGDFALQAIMRHRIRDAGNASSPRAQAPRRPARPSAGSRRAYRPQAAARPAPAPACQIRCGPAPPPAPPRRRPASALS